MDPPVAQEDISLPRTIDADIHMTSVWESGENPLNECLNHCKSLCGNDLFPLLREGSLSLFRLRLATSRTSTVSAFVGPGRHRREKRTRTSRENGSKQRSARRDRFSPLPTNLLRFRSWNRFRALLSELLLTLMLKTGHGFGKKTPQLMGISRKPGSFLKNRKGMGFADLTTM